MQSPRKPHQVVVDDVAACGGFAPVALCNARVALGCRRQRIDGAAKNGLEIICLHDQVASISKVLFEKTADESVDLHDRRGNSGYANLRGEGFAAANRQRQLSPRGECARPLLLRKEQGQKAGLIRIIAEVEAAL